MDPNTIPPTQPAAGAAPVAGPATNPAAPASPIPSPASPVAPAEPAMAAAPTPTAPVAPAPAAPVNADVANAALNPPVNPVVAPGANPAATPAAGAAAGSMSMNQMFQTQPAAPGVLDETTAIAVPEGPKPPDPVEEELKAPLKAAGPVPGSIGSAVSMPPADGQPQPGQPQNVAFNDPAQAGQNPMTAGAPGTPAAKKPGILDKLMAKTKMNKNTLILLAVVAGLVVVVLVAVLIMVATGAL